MRCQPIDVYVMLCVILGCANDPQTNPDDTTADASSSEVDGPLAPPTGACPTTGGACSKQDGLIAVWNLDEFSDGTTPVSRKDATPCGHDLPDTNRVASTETARGGARAARHVYAQGMPDDFVRPDDASLSVFHNGHSYTAALWFQIFQGAPASGKIFIKGMVNPGTDATREFGLEYQHCPPPSGCANHGVTTDHLHFGVFDSDPGGQAAVLDIPTSDFDPQAHLGEWQFVMMWHDDVEKTVYIQLNNGTVYSKRTAEVTIRDTDAPIKIGGLLDAFDGIVDEVMIWTRVLTPQERTSVFAKGLACAATD